MNTIEYRNVSVRFHFEIEEDEFKAIFEIPICLVTGLVSGPTIGNFSSGAFLPYGDGSIKEAKLVSLLCGITHQYGLGVFDIGTPYFNETKWLMDDQFSQFLKCNFNWTIELARGNAEFSKQLRNFPMKYNIAEASLMAPTLDPTIENFASGAFLPHGRDMGEAIKNAEPVALLAGITYQDGLGVFDIDKPFFNKKKNLTEDDQLAEFLQTNLNWSSELVAENLAKLKENYSFSNLLKDFSIKFNFAELCTDIWFYNFYENFKLEGPKTTQAVAKKYFYLFNYRSEINPSRAYQDSLTSAAVGDDIVYLLCPKMFRDNCLSTLDYEKITIFRLIKTMCGIWTSFCSTGTPELPQRDLKWIPSCENPCFLELSTRTHLEEGLIRNRFRQLWMTLTEAERTLAPQLPSFSSAFPNHSTFHF